VAKKKSGGRVPLFAALVAALGLLVAHLLDCLPGFGTGGDPATGVPAEPEHEDEPDPELVGKVDEEPEARAAVVVRGAECQLGGEPTPCDAVCERLQADSDPSRGIDVDATHGSHGAVEALVRCLTEAGFANVEVRSE
jgi:hypothetical protein